MNGDEILFTVTSRVTPTSWGDKITLMLLNPDGSVCVQESWECGPDGFTGAQESDMASWVSEETKEFLDTYFAAAWEQAHQFDGNR